MVGTVIRPVSVLWHEHNHCTTTTQCIGLFFSEFEVIADQSRITFLNISNIVVSTAVFCMSHIFCILEIVHLVIDWLFSHYFIAVQYAVDVVISVDVYLLFLVFNCHQSLLKDLWSMDRLSFFLDRTNCMMCGGTGQHTLQCKTMM